MSSGYSYHLKILEKEVFLSFFFKELNKFFKYYFEKNVIYILPFGKSKKKPDLTLECVVKGE